MVPRCRIREPPGWWVEASINGASGLKARGSLLIEAVIAIFLLLMGVLVFAALFQRSAQLSRVQATLAAQINLADSVMAEIREWASDPTHYDSDWSTWNGRTRTDPNNSSVEATVRCVGAGRDLLSPASELEFNYSSTRRRSLTKAVVPVEITVSGPQVMDFVVVSQVAPAIRTLPADAEVSVTRVSGTEPIPRGGTATYRATLADQNGVDIPYVTFEWFLLPQTGNAGLESSNAGRNGKLMPVRNEFRLPNGDIGFAPGTIRLRARARYHGKVLENGDPALLPNTVVELQ